MTSPFKSSQTDTQRVEKAAVEALDTADGDLSEEVLSDIAQARMKAIAAARQKKAGWSRNLIRSFDRTIDSVRFSLSLDNYKVAAPLAVAVAVTVLVSYDQNNQIPALPAELLSGDVPTEELAMLEDLEFASWLAEQQQEGLL